MKKMSLIMATSHLDSHGDILTREFLESLARRVNTNAIPLGVEHDPRIPPIGRITSARVTTLEDGAFAVEAEAEVFEPGDNPPLIGGREIPLRVPLEHHLQVSYDRSFYDEESQRLINEIAALFKSDPVREEKKALDPVTILTIVGAFTLGGVASGFLNKIGSDLLDAVKKKITETIDGKRKTAEEVLLVFAFCVAMEDHPVEIDVILTNPSPADIAAFLTTGLLEVDTMIAAKAANEDIRKVVCAYSAGELNLMFAVRRDGVPLLPVRAAKAGP
jgi:hypothetical protein